MSASGLAVTLTKLLPLALVSSSAEGDWRFQGQLNKVPSTYGNEYNLELKLVKRTGKKSPASDLLSGLIVHRLEAFLLSVPFAFCASLAEKGKKNNLPNLRARTFELTRILVSPSTGR